MAIVVEFGPTSLMTQVLLVQPLVLFNLPVLLVIHDKHFILICQSFIELAKLWKHYFGQQFSHLFQKCNNTLEFHSRFVSENQVMIKNLPDTNLW